jgi:hypothetical protein
MKEKRSKQGYPKSVDIKKRHDLCGYGSNRIYRVTKDEAVAISREFKFPTDFQKTYHETAVDFYYFNNGHGEFHAIFFLPRSDKQT